MSVDALSGSVPGSYLTITPAAVEFQVETTALTARGVISETQATSRAPVVAFCVESTIHMPLVNR